MTRRRLLALFGAIPLLGGLAPVLSFLARERAPERVIPHGGFRAGYFPNVRLQTHEGETVRFYDDLIKDRAVVVNVVDTRSAMCHAVTHHLRLVQQALGQRMGRELSIYSLAADPEKDTPAVLKRYAEAHGVGPGWLFLTGERDDLELLRQKLGFLDPEPVADDEGESHLAMMRYGNEAHEQWAACPALSNQEQMVEQISWMLIDRRA